MYTISLGGKTQIHSFTTQLKFETSIPLPKLNSKLENTLAPTALFHFGRGRREFPSEEQTGPRGRGESDT